jgi:membrane protease YdiL (CAAX protease family)
MAFEKQHATKARRLLEQAVQANPQSEHGWLWLAEAVHTKAERRYCLAQALSLNRRNALVRRELRALGAGSIHSPWVGTGRSRWANTPFWVGILRTAREQPVPILVGYLLAITVTEFFTLIVDPRIGLWGHSALLAVLVVHAALIWGRPFYRLVLTLTFAPLIRLVSLTMPLARFPLVYWYLMTSIPLLVTAFLIAYVVGYSRQQIGLVLGKLPVQFLVGLSGLILGAIEYVLLRPEPMFETFTWNSLGVPALILLVCTGFTEELIFRGIMQRSAVETIGNLGGLYVAAIFAMMHMGHASWMDIPFVFGVSLFFSWVVNKTGSILGVTIAHGLTNIMLFLILPALF